MPDRLSRLLTAMRRIPYWWAYGTSTSILLVSFGFWWHLVHMSPGHVFWGMIETSLATRSANVENTQRSGDDFLRQQVQFELGTVNMAHSLTNLRQQGTQIKAEIIGTPTADYSRYRSIATTQKDSKGKTPDFSSIQGIWSKSEAMAQTETQAAGQQLFAQAVLGIGLPVGSVPVPIGEVTPRQRADLLRYIKDEGIYATDYAKVTKQRSQGRLLYTYDVTIQTISYVRVMKTFAGYLGLHELDKVDPNSYQTAQPLRVKLTIDAHTRQLVSLKNGDSYEQHYTGYGVPVHVALPSKPISAQELQQRLTQIGAQ